MGILVNNVKTSSSCAHRTLRYTYSVSFSALLSTLAAEIRYWTYANESLNSDGFTGTVVYFLLPMGMVVLNCLEVEVRELAGAGVHNAGNTDSGSRYTASLR